jgi:hypothetical protein
MEADKATRMLGEFRQLIDRWELELGAKPVWWRRYPAMQTDEAPRKGSSATSRPEKSQERATGPKRLARRVDTHKPAAGADLGGGE